jgi:hypothetical protein
MPILTITLKGEELKKKTVNLHDPLNLRYFKLLHVNHNLTGVDLKLIDAVSGTTGQAGTDPATFAVATEASKQLLMFAQVSFLTSKDVSFYESNANDSGYSHNVFSVGETSDTDAKIEFKELFKTLTTRPTQVHQPFSVQLYAYDTSVATAEQAPDVVAQYGLNYPGTSWQAATYHNRLRPVAEMVSTALTDNKFMTLTFEYDEYDVAPRTH